MKILSIETSCDETAMAIVEAKGALKNPQFKVLENIVSSQISVHRPFGGVVPNLAKREHLKNLPKIYRELTKKRKNLETSIDAIAVTVGPGLEPALWTGITFAQTLSERINKPLIGANHMEGHLYSNWLPIREIRSTKSEISNKSLKPKTQNLKTQIKFPAIALVVSGGHTILLHMTAINKWTNLGETLDDAAGEAFDKVARMLELPYPGGPEIQRLAAKGDPNAIKFPRPLLNPKSPKDKYNFSFSGLKTSVLYYLRDHPITDLTDKSGQRGNKSQRSPQKSAKSVFSADVAASFQQAVIDVLVKKTIRAAEEYKAKTILLCGGVSANKPLQESLKANSSKLKANFVVPDFQFNTDNAAMIATAAYINLLQKKTLPIKANGNLNL